MTQVRSFMLVDGKELIADLIAPTSVGWQIKSPLVIHMMRGSDGGPSLAFAPWSMIHADGQVVELLDSALMARPTEVLPEVEASYLSNTTGILVPPKGGGQILLS